VKRNINVNWKKKKSINVHCNQAELSHVSIDDSAQGEYRNHEVHGVYILTGTLTTLNQKNSSSLKGVLLSHDDAMMILARPPPPPPGRLAYEGEGNARRPSFGYAELDLTVIPYRSIA